MLAIKVTAQEICHAVTFDRAVNRLIVLCVNVTSKGYDGENVDEASRGKLNEVTELCELQQSLIREAFTDRDRRQEVARHLSTAYA